MSDRSKPANLTLGRALHLARAGFVVFPCCKGEKRPATPNGLLDATADEATIRRWFDNDHEYNLAVACGPQPNGINLLAIDIDPDHGGEETWKELIDGHEVPDGPMHVTRSGGQHLFFDMPIGLHNTSGRLGQGVDTRGIGGYVVVPPSRVVDGDTGEIGQYTTSRDTALSVVPVPELPSWLLVLLDDDEMTVAQSRHPSQVGGLLSFGDSVADLARVGWVWEVELDRDGWILVRRRGTDSYWTRPGKNPRDGHSAVLHGDDGPLVVFTTERPPGGWDTRHGEGSSFSPWDYIVAYRAGGDTRQAAAIVRARPTWQPGPASSAGLGDEVGDTQGTPLYPPPEFYEQRPWMATVAQKAYSAGGSPSAHLLAYLCRWTTLIPPGYSIPAINGAASSFDLLCVIAGKSGAGKTSPMRNAAELLPVLRTDLRMSLGIGSGEGIVEMFYGKRDILDDNGKRTGSERAKIITGVNFSVSEGLIFSDLAERGGTTHVTRLCDAWSGAPLSTANASADTFRHIDEDQYRLTLMMGIQSTQAYKLITDDATSQGFVGRLLFAWSEEPRISPRPRPPDPFVLPVPPEIAIPATAETPKRYTRTYLTYPDHFVTEIQEAADRRVGTNVPVEDHHHDLMRCKVAGIVALMDGRLDVNDDDIAIATTLCDCSRATRLHLRAVRRLQVNEGDHNQAVRQAVIKETINSERERVGVLKMAENIRDKLQARGPMSKSDLRRMVTAKTTRHRLDPALVLAIANGWVRAVAKRYEAVES